MISAVIVLALLSLLVATDPEPVGLPPPLPPEPPLRPGNKSEPATVSPTRQLAA